MFTLKAVMHFCFEGDGIDNCLPGSSDHSDTEVECSGENSGNSVGIGCGGSSGMCGPKTAGSKSCSRLVKKKGMYTTIINHEKVKIYVQVLREDVKIMTMVMMLPKFL